MGQAPSSAAKAEQQSAPDVLESAKKPAPLLESSPLVPGGGVVFAFVMCVAPLFPSLACMPFFGGSGCSEDLTHFVFATREGRSVTGFQ